MTIKFVNNLFLIWLCCSHVVHGVKVNHASDMHGIHFKVYAYEYPPGMSIVKNSPDGNVSYKGSAIEFITYFGNHLKLSLEYVQENASEVKKKGQVIPAVQALVNKEVDFCSFPMISTTSDRWSIMDFTSLVMQEAYQLLVPWPEEESRLTAVIRPFNITTWISILGTSFLLVGFLAGLPFTYRYWNQRVVSDNPAHRTDLSFKIFGNAVMYVVGIYTQHGANPSQIGITRRFILRLMLALWLLMSVVLSNLYMGTVTSYLTVNKLKPIPNSLEELTADFDEYPHKCLLTMGKDHPVRKMLSNSTKAAQQKIIEWTAQHPEFSTTVFSEIADNIIKHHCSQIGIKGTHLLLISRDYKANKGICRMTTSRPLTDFTFSSSFQLQKDSPYTSVINQYVLQANSMGLINYWKQMSQNGAVDKCKIKNDQYNAGRVTPIKLIELSSAFLVLGVGLTLSALVFLAERCFAYLRISSK